MDEIKVRIGDHIYEGIIKERSQNGGGSKFMHIVFVDLDEKCVLSDSTPPPPAEVLVVDDWRSAKIDRIPTAPHFRRIVLSFED